MDPVASGCNHQDDDEQYLGKMHCRAYYVVHAIAAAAAAAHLPPATANSAACHHRGNYQKRGPSCGRTNAKAISNYEEGGWKPRLIEAYVVIL